MNSHRRSRWRGSRAALGSSRSRTSGRGEQPDRDVHTLPVAAREGGHLIPGPVAQVGELEHAIHGVRRVRNPLEAGEQLEVLGHGELPVEPRLTGAPSPTSPGDFDTLPPSGRWIPARIESSVVLPAPLGPMMATCSPRAAENDTPFSASRSPKRLVRFVASSTGGEPAAAVLAAGLAVHGGGAWQNRPGEAPVRRRRGGRSWPADAGLAAACAARGAPAGFRGGERGELRRRRGHHRAHRPRAAGYGRRRDHARQPRLPPPRGLRVPRPRGADRPPGELPQGQPRARAHRGGARRHAARRDQRLRAALPGRRALALRRGGRAGGRAARTRPTTCWWTCTPRPRARRWRSAGTSTAASPPAWARTPTCRRPTPACSRAAPPTSPTWA